MGRWLVGRKEMNLLVLLSLKLDLRSLYMNGFLL